MKKTIVILFAAFVGVALMSGCHRWHYDGHHHGHHGHDRGHHDGHRRH